MNVSIPGPGNTSDVFQTVLWEGGSRWNKKPESPLFPLILTGADVVGVVVSIRDWEPQG